MPLPDPARPGGSCTLVLSNALGDSVLMMALAHDLMQSGRAVRVHGRVGEQLAAWYPWANTAPAAHERHDLVFALYDLELGKVPGPSDRSVAVSSLPDFRQTGDHMLERIRASGRHLGVAAPGRASGIVIPEGPARQRDPRRVVIHPTASHPEKAWQPAKFLALAQALAERGFRPNFIVAPDEFAAWRDVETAHGIPVCAFPTLGNLAAWIAGSGWFIGNDSGPGHLASAIGVPTVSLFMRRRLARTWRPGWAPGRVVLPLQLLPGAALRERHWQRLLSVRRVLRAFDDLRGEVEGRAT